MNPVKLYFSILLLTIAGLLLIGSLNISKLNKVNVIELGKKFMGGNIKEYSLEEAKTYSCTLEKPANRTIILRIDDITRWNNLDLMKDIVDETTFRNYGVSLGVIPHKLEENYDLIRWLQKIKENSLIELSMHGYDHSKEEFANLNYEEATKTLTLGRDIMIRLFGEIPINFIPPYNVDSQGTIDALKDLGFKTFSGNQREYDFEDEFVKAGYTTTTYYYSQDKFVSADEVLSECKTTLDNKQVCVIMIHPQDFTNNGKIDEQKYAEFIKVLNGLEELNAQVVNFRQAFCEEQ